MSSFTPRPFPPPSLAGVPAEYIVDQLRNLAPHYWNRLETADCTIIVPVPHPQGRPAPDSHRSPTPVSKHEVLNSERSSSATESDLQSSPRLSLQLHVDYLSAHSSFLRGLLGGTSPLDLINATHSRPSSETLHVPEDRLPRILPSSPNHPTIFLPVPDPSSFRILVHWMYFGHFDHIESALARGTVHWEGLARNVEYLGLSNEIKVFLGRWYSTWLQPTQHCAWDDEDSEIDSDDEDSGVQEHGSDSPRGRTRTVWPIFHPSLSRHHSA